MRGLIIREPWIGMILDGSKTWELHTQHTTMRGEIALIRKKYRPDHCQVGPVGRGRIAAAFRTPQRRFAG